MIGKPLSARSVRGVAITALCLLALSYLALETAERNSVWGDRTALWEDAAAKAPRSYRAHNNLGNCYLLEGRLLEARAAYERAVEIGPRRLDDVEAYFNLGLIAERLGQRETAVIWYRRFLQRVPAKFSHVVAPLMARFPELRAPPADR